MSRPVISFVVAMDHNRLIGVDGGLPWRLPEDMKHFRRVTMGKPVLMGRLTYESIPLRFRPLPGRTNIVLTSQEGYEAPGCIVVHSLAEALAAAAGQPELMVIGGAQLYEQLLPQAERLYLTLVEGEFSGDAYFPEVDLSQWRELSRQEFERGEGHDAAFTIFLVERNGQPAAPDLLTRSG
jgi:dihydrofolate reductase